MPGPSNVIARSRLIAGAAFVLVTVLLAAAGCGSPEDAVLTAWSEYHRAMMTSDVPSARALLAAGRGAELAGPEAAAGLELRSALVPSDPEITGVEVSTTRATVSVVGPVDGQSVSGRISFAKESGAWKILEEEWTLDPSSTLSSSSAPTPDAILARDYSAGVEAAPTNSAAITAHDGAVTDLAFTRDGRAIVSIGYDDHRLRLWDAMSGALLDDVECAHRPSDMALISDGTAAYVVDSKGHVTEWPVEADSFGEPSVLAGRAGRSPRIAVGASGRRAVTTSWDEPAKLWDLGARTYLQALPKSEKMRGVAFSPIGPTVACGSHGDYFAVWDLDRLAWPVGARKKHRVPNAAPQSEVQSVAFSPDGRWLATGHLDTSLSIWDVKRGKQIHNWYIQDSPARDVEFSPCGTVLATAQDDGQIHLWDAETRRPYFRLRAHEGAALSLAFNPADGVTLATGGEDGMIRIWR